MLIALSASKRPDRCNGIINGTETPLTLVGTSPGQEITPREAVSDALVNALVEDGTLPGLVAAIEEYGKLSEQEPAEDEHAAAAAAQSS